jgi:hypothetical protein
MFAGALTIGFSHKTETYTAPTCKMFAGSHELFCAMHAGIYQLKKSPGTKSLWARHSIDNNKDIHKRQTSALKHQVHWMTSVTRIAIQVLLFHMQKFITFKIAWIMSLLVWTDGLKIVNLYQILTNCLKLHTYNKTHIYLNIGYDYRTI